MVSFMKITVAVVGYVRLSLAVLLAQNHYYLQGVLDDCLAFSVVSW